MDCVQIVTKQYKEFKKNAKNNHNSSVNRKGIV